MNARDFELAEKLFEFLADDAGIFQNALMHVAQRGHVGAVEFLLGLRNCPASVCRSTLYELRGILQSNDQNTNRPYDEQIILHSHVIEDSTAHRAIENRRQALQDIIKILKHFLKTRKK